MSLSNCSPYARTYLPLSQCFSTNFIPGPLGWICNWFSATAWKVLCWVWLYRICITKTRGILNVLFQATWVSSVMTPIPHHPILRIPALNQCSSPWQVTDLPGNIQQFLEGSWGPNLRNTTWKLKHGWSSLAATETPAAAIMGTSVM